MSLEIRNTDNLVTPEGFRMKVLVYALPGVGKTSWVSTAPNPGLIACETGQGEGLLSVANSGHDYITPTSMPEWETACGGTLFRDKDSIVVDSISEMSRTFIKEYALSFPRKSGSTPKRQAGVPEQDDYGTMGELTRRTLRRLIDSNPTKHVIVTATERHKDADPEKGQAESVIGPDLPGAMMFGCTAMFDFVFRMRVRQKLAIPGDAKSRFSQRYLVSQPDGSGVITKCRANDGKGGSLLAAEEPVNLVTGEGTIPWLIAKILKGYADGKAK